MEHVLTYIPDKSKRVANMKDVIGNSSEARALLKHMTNRLIALPGGEARFDDVVEWLNSNGYIGSKFVRFFVDEVRSNIMTLATMDRFIELCAHRSREWFLDMTFGEIWDEVHRTIVQYLDKDISIKQKQSALINGITTCLLSFRLFAYDVEDTLLRIDLLVVLLLRDKILYTHFCQVMKQKGLYVVFSALPHESRPFEIFRIVFRCLTWGEVFLLSMAGF